MSKRIGVLGLVAAVLVAAATAIFQSEAAPRPTSESEPAPPPSLHAGAFDPDLADEPQSGALPPNHPPIGASSPHGSPMPAASDEPAALEWKVPEGWRAIPNPNAIRIATYAVPGGAGADAAEMSVVRAGGTTDANIERWMGQIDGATLRQRAEKTVHGLDVTIVELTGTNAGMLAAIVETQGSPYFFKLTGPPARLRAARPAFDALVASMSASARSR